MAVQPENRNTGHSTAYGRMVDYRLGKLERLGLVSGRWLDCGCAEGDYAVGLVHRGALSVVGIDIRPESIEVACTRWNDVPGVSFCVASADRVPFPEASFDRILLNEVLEHVEDEERSLSELHRLLVRGGNLIVFSPNRWFPFEGHGLACRFETLRFPTPLIPWLPQRLFSRWLQARNYWPRELRRLVTQAGFEVVTLDFALPLFEQYSWLPSPLRRLYNRHFDFFDGHRNLRRFGVSTLVVGRKR